VVSIHAMGKAALEKINVSSVVDSTGPSIAKSISVACWRTVDVSIVLICTVAKVIKLMTVIIVLCSDGFDAC